MRIKPDCFYTPEQVSQHWQIKFETLEHWRTTNRYPALTYSRIGGSVRYKGSVILAFENQNPREVKAGKSSGPRPRKARKQLKPASSRRLKA